MADETQDPKTVLTSQNQIKCKQCGGTLIFAPGTTTLQCEFCGCTNEIDTSKWDYAEMQARHNFLADLEQLPEAETEEIHIVKCDCCGAETTFEKNVVSAKCDFCGSPITISNGKTTKQIKPQGVIPFAVSQDAGREKYSKWISGLWFAPGDLKNSASMESGLSGVYIPYWLYYANTLTAYKGQRGEYYYTEEEYKDSDGTVKKRKKQHTRWYPTSGTLEKKFSDIVIPASTSLPSGYTSILRKWKLDGIVPYNDQTLCGYKAESYSIDLKDAYKDAQSIMKEQIEDAIEDKIGGDDQKIDKMDITESDIEYKHILAPIWISAFRYNGKSYRFLINGQTGEISGDRPYSTIKIVVAILAAIAAIALLVMLLS